MRWHPHLRPRLASLKLDDTRNRMPQTDGGGLITKTTSPVATKHLITMPTSVRINHDKTK